MFLLVYPPPPPTAHFLSLVFPFFFYLFKAHRLAPLDRLGKTRLRLSVKAAASSTSCIVARGEQV